MKKRNKWKDFFYFTRSERYGTWILSLLLILSFLLPRLNVFTPAPRTDFSKLDRALALWEAKRHLPKGQQTASERKEQHNDKEGQSPSAAKLFPFDPNKASREELLRLGFSGSLARTLIRFRHSGAHFSRAEDLLKVYGMEPEFYQRLRPYIRLVEEQKEASSALVVNQKTRNTAPVEALDKPDIKTIDINLASQADWDALPGIGPYYAGRILRFREALGGFKEVDQIAETYGLPDSVFQKIKPFLQKKSPVHPLLLNQASTEVLSRHPYVSKKQAEVLFAYRKRYGPFSKIEDLSNAGIFSEAELEKLKPYLSFETP